MQDIIRLKQDDSFALCDAMGNVRPLGVEQHGLYRDDTRFLSRLVLDVAGHHPLLLRSAVRADDGMLVVDLTNPVCATPEGSIIPQGTLHLLRTAFLWDNTWYAQIQVCNYGGTHARVPLAFHYEADFVDVFEVRGHRRERRGTCDPPRVQGNSVVRAYRGLDGVQRETWITFTPVPDALEPGRAQFWIDLPPRRTTDLFLTVACRCVGERTTAISHAAAFQQARACRERWQRGACAVTTSNAQFNAWLDSARSDLLMMLTENDHGLYPYAGVPWYSTVFGRDGIITALATLWIHPDVARGVLACLAAHQARGVDAEREAEPGKILHELRRGELANTREIPFDRYYGSIDSTPLYVILAGRYFTRTGDREFIARLWPAIEAALHWIDTRGDRDGDGFIEYACANTRGLRNQGWKDSDDAVFHADGRIAPLPIALCEVQGYVYEAKLQAARLAEALGFPHRARLLRHAAATLREQFHRQFWCAEMGMYALALDGDKQPCRVRSSNAGHCLFTGIADPAYARRSARQLLSDSFFTGWGIRTIAASEARYNPLSYHNGSVWPHDNAVIAAGLSRYGFTAEAAQILAGLFDASQFMDAHRLPELFCGFERRPGEGPTGYPVACLPQTWASVSVYMLLQACLGLSIDALNRRVTFDAPVLPAGVQEVGIRNLRVGTGSVDLVVNGRAGPIDISVERSEGDVEVVITPAAR